MQIAGCGTFQCWVQSDKRTQQELKGQSVRIKKEHFYRD